MRRSNDDHPSLLTRIRNSRIFQRALRVLQFLSSVISLGLFSARLYKVYLNVRRASTSNGAVEGILAAAVAYTLTVMLLKFCLKSGASKILRWALVVLDVLFAGAFIAVADLTRPNGGPSGPCRNTVYAPVIPKGQNCSLPWGTFILAIVSTLLHAISAIFYEIKDHRRKNKEHREMSEAASQQNADGVGHGQGY